MRVEVATVLLLLALLPRPSSTTTETRSSGAAVHRSSVPLCDRQVAILGSEQWFFGPRGPFVCSMTNTVLCTDGRYCCCPARTLWSGQMQGCATCSAAVTEAKTADNAGIEEMTGSLAVIVQPAFETQVTCAAMGEQVPLYDRETLLSAKRKASVPYCSSVAGCELTITGLEPATAYRVWCVIEDGGLGDVSPPAGLYLATRAVPLRWRLDEEKPATYDAIHVLAWPQIQCHVTCVVRDIDRGTERHVRQLCAESGCKITISFLVPNSPYEVRCSTSEGASTTQVELEVPRFAQTKAAPLHFLSAEAPSFGSVVVHLKPEASTEILCALFKQKNLQRRPRATSRHSDKHGVTLPEDSASGASASGAATEDQSMVLDMAREQEVKVWMIRRAAYQRAKWCNGSGSLTEEDNTCALPISELQPGTAYTAACMPAGGHDEDVTPRRGALVTTMREEPGRNRGMLPGWALVLSIGAYLLIASVFLTAVVGSLHKEQNCDFADLRQGRGGSSNSSAARTLLQHTDHDTALPPPTSKQTRSCGSSCCGCLFESLRAVGFLHIVGIIVYVAFVLPIYAAYAYRRDWL